MEEASMQDVPSSQDRGQAENADHKGHGVGRALMVAAADAREGLPFAGARHSGFSADGLVALQAAFQEIGVRQRADSAGQPRPR